MEANHHIGVALDQTEKRKRPFSQIPTRETAFGCPRDYLDNRFVYVVVSARARGLSVGVNMNPDKLCNFKCVYCEVQHNERPRENILNAEVMATELTKTLSFVLSGRLRERPSYHSSPDELLQLR
ncbi:MAG: hypothetical protein H7Y43_14260, partial [Akkermansiaceae bacterium]|nr:hypothetical protein [Verrucomicrobiales bacterium]